MLKHTFKQFGAQWMGLSRPVFQQETAPNVPSTVHQKMEIEKKKALDVSEIKRKFDAAEAVKNKSYEELLTAIQREKMDKDTFTEEDFKAEDLNAMEKEVIETGSVLPATQEKIDTKLAMIKEWLEKPVIKDFLHANTINEKEYPAEAAFKKTIRNLLENHVYEKQLQDYKAASEKNEATVESAIVTTVTRMETVIEAGEGLKSFGKEGKFGSFETAFEGAIKAPEFAVFRESRENVADVKVAQGYRQLFLSLMESETGKFKTDLGFGTGFGEDPVENKKNYPDIYKLWLERKGNDGAFKDRESKSNNVEVVKKSITEPIDPGLMRKVEIVIPDILDPNNAPKNQDEAKANINVIEAFKAKHYALHNSKALSDADPIKNFEGKYESDRGLVEKYLNLAKAQRDLLAANEGINRFDKEFVASKMSNRTEVVKICLQKFKMALNTVDGVLKEAGLSENLNTEVKRQLITEVYKNGAFSLKEKSDGTPVFESNAKAFSTVLKDILGSEYFNANYEKPLSNEQRDLLAIAVKRGLEQGRLQNEIDIQKNDTTVNTSETKTYVERELAFRKFPKAVRDMLEAQNAGDRQTAFNALPQEYKNIFEPNGQLKAKMEELRTALKNDNETNILVNQVYYGDRTENIFEKTKAEKTKIEKAIEEAQKAIAARREKESARTAYEQATTGSAKEADIRGYVGNKLKMGEMEANEEAMKACLKDPTTKENRDWIASAKGKLVQEDKGDSRFRSTDNISITYNLLDRSTKGLEGMFADVMDVEFRGLYPSYLKEVDKNKDLDVGNWKTLFDSHDRKDRQKLIDLFKKIIPPSKEGGKENVIFLLENMDNDSVMGLLSKTEGEMKSPKNRAKAAALSVVGIIRAQILKEKELSSKTVAQQQEYERRLGGKTISEYMTNYLGTFWKMGMSGSWTEKGVAAFVGYMLFKAASNAFGEKPGVGGNLLKLGLGFMALDIGMKKTTGKGVLERASIHNIHNAFEGTDEAALVKHGHEIADSNFMGVSINEEQQFEAVHQMRGVPFNKLVEWYTAVRNNPENIKPAAGKPDLFSKLKPSIDTGAIYEHGRHPNLDPDLLGRVAVYKTIHSLFDYAANQDGHSNDVDYGQKSIEARWINPLKPKGSKEVAGTRFTNWMPPENILDKYKKNPNGPTWKEVMEIEIRQTDRLATIDDNYIAQGINWGKETAQAALDYTRVSILAPTRQKLNEYLNSAHYRWTPQARALIGDMADKVSSEAQFAEDKVVLWYDANKDEAGNLVGKHIDVIKKAAGAPFQLILWVDKNVIEFADTGINRVQGILETKYGTGIPMPIVDKEPTNSLFIQGETRHFFGEEYADHFKDAWGNNDSSTSKLAIDETGVNAGKIEEIRRGLEAAFPTDPIAVNNFLPGEIEKAKLGPIAYYVGEMGINDVPEQHRDNPYNVINYMKGHAREKVSKELKEKLRASNKNVDKYDEKYFKEYLRSITDVPVIKTGAGGKPEKMYFFYRMPLEESMEVYRKRTGTWHDSSDPRELKDAPPFIADPSKSVLDNLAMAYAKNQNLDLVKKVLGGVLLIAPQQVARIVTGLASLAKGAVPANWPNLKKFFETLELSDDTKTKFDEYSGAYVSEYLVMSAYYKGGKEYDDNGNVVADWSKADAEQHRKDATGGIFKFKPSIVTPPSTPPPAPTPGTP